MKTQINVRVSPITHDRLEFLTEKYGTKTAVVEVAITLLYTQFVNTESPKDKTTRELLK